jgi:hypothetical protein
MELKIQRNTTKDNKIIGNLQGELADFVVRQYHEEFKGTNADFNKTMGEGEVLKHSNTIFNNFANILLRQETGNTTKVLTGEDVVQHWDSLPNRDSTYADTCGVAVYPNKGANEEHRQRVLDIIGKDSTNIPLIVYGLKPVRCDNDDGFQFAESDYILTKEAPYLQRDGKVQHDETLGNLVSSKKGVSVWTPSNQAGLGRLCRGRNGGLSAWSGILLCSYSIGRVQILQDPKGLDEKFSDQYANVLAEIQGLPEDMRDAISHYAMNDPSQLEKLAK